MTFHFQLAVTFAEQIYEEDCRKAARSLYLSIKCSKVAFASMSLRKNPLIGVGKRKLIHPTDQVIFQLFNYVQIFEVYI